MPQVVSPIPEAQRLVPSEKVEHRKPARHSSSLAHVPHSSVEAQEERLPIRRAAARARNLPEGVVNEDFMAGDSGRSS